MTKTINLWKNGEYEYPCAGDFLPNITAYLHEDKQVRPAMIVVPGGGYAMVSPTEGEIVAKKFYHAGYQAFVLTYTTNMFRVKALDKQPLKDISRAVRYIRKYAEELMIKNNLVVCCGFSAGAHLVGSLAVHYQDEELKSEPYGEISNRPDAVLLSYPVITTGKYAHGDSFELLLGQEPTEEQLTWASNNFGEESLYTMMQQWQTLKTLYEQNPAMITDVFVSSAKAETLLEFVAEWSKATADFQQQEQQKADASVSQWPAMAIAWLSKIGK